MRGRNARDEDRDRERDWEREEEREWERQKGGARERERGREREREGGGVRGGDAGGYRREGQGRNDGGRDAHGRHRDCYGGSKGTGKSQDLKNIDINKQIMGVAGASKLCTLIKARVAEFNHVVTAPHICLSYDLKYMTF